MECPACTRGLREVTAGELSVDVCDGGCGGIWLDAGELAGIRSEFESDETRSNAAAKHLDDAFGQWMFEEETKTGEFLVKAELVAHYTRHIRPSYYLFGT